MRTAAHEAVRRRLRLRFVAAALPRRRHDRLRHDTRDTGPPRGSAPTAGEPLREPAVVVPPAARRPMGPVGPLGVGTVRPSRPPPWPLRRAPPARESGDAEPDRAPRPDSPSGLRPDA
ncbi:hypothetical protein GCM10017562_06340 [Streptomyces roseofulvus]